LCVVEENEVLPDYTVVYGPGQRRIDETEVDDLKIKLVKKQVDVLRKLIPSNISKFQ
jgi:dynactin-6